MIVWFHIWFCNVNISNFCLQFHQHHDHHLWFQSHDLENLVIQIHIVFQHCSNNLGSSYPYLAYYCPDSAGVFSSSNNKYYLAGASTTPTQGRTTSVGGNQPLSIDIMQPTAFVGNLFIYAGDEWIIIHFVILCVTFLYHNGFVCVFCSYVSLDIRWTFHVSSTCTRLPKLQGFVPQTISD